MNRFAELLDRLAYEPGRNAKLRLIAEYLRSTPDPERGWALAALTGALTFKHAKGGMIRALIMERTDPTLFALSYDYVGDLSETVALMWPANPERKPNSAPTLSDVVKTLSTLGKRPSTSIRSQNVQAPIRSAPNPASRVTATYIEPSPIAAARMNV